MAGYLKQSAGIATNMEMAESWAVKQPMAWRAKLVDGSLWVKLLSAASRWAERSSVLRLLLLVLQYRAPLPDLDIVYVHNDQDPSHIGGPLVLTNAHAHGHSSLPVPEFTWLGWFTHTPPWCELFNELNSTAAARPWEGRIDRAYFSGSLSNGGNRKSLGQSSCPKMALSTQRTHLSPPRYNSLLPPSFLLTAASCAPHLQCTL